MSGIAQEEALDRARLQPGREVARFWRATAYDDLECLSARFVRHRYAPHTHDTYAIGVIVAGAEGFVCRGERQTAGTGQFAVVEPGELHDGYPVGGGYAYRMFYPSVALMTETLADAAEGAPVAPPHFASNVIDDADLAGRFVRLHDALDCGVGRLGRDQALVTTLARLVRRHARGTVRPGAPGHDPGRVQRVVHFLEDRLADDPGLSDLAAFAGCSRFHLIRCFSRATGLTPHAWLVDRRVRAAKRHLAAGLRPAEVAARCGFADQAHLTRAFKARVGVTPAVYCRAHG
jgi:AraC-like DNA-binding protein